MYPILKALAGRVREVTLPMWLMAAMALTFYLVYPHRH
jgi:xanthine/uracil/vitamin C permease (AzgA family)